MAQPTSEQLRSAIDRGRTWDKVPVPDPAAAPLDTDAEAAGTPASGEAVAAAMREEIHAGAAEGDRNPIFPLAVGVIGASLAFAVLGAFLWLLLG